jgi:D-tagatose-1,6-bisphosphate aldolase subunit GatZ/KbaZ
VITDVSINDLLQAIWQIEEENGQQVTLLGIGPMSRNVIRASLELAKEMEFPLMFIASRNQIDARELGGGYVMDLDQAGFVKVIKDLAADVGFKGILYICRDHGGPWQRDEEFRQRLPLVEAMRLGKLSFLTDVEHGFNVLHIDPTKDPVINGSVSLDLVIDRVLELVEYIQAEAAARGLADPKTIGYEIGTEETTGGLIAIDAFEGFLAKLSKEFKRRGWPKPAFIVGQTGTLVKMARNVGCFDTDTARALAGVARRYGVGFKEHNADYLSDDILSAHPMLGITAANVAPEFGAAETGAYLELAGIEKAALQAANSGGAAPDRGVRESGFLQALENAVLTSNRWKKWLPDGKAYLSAEDLKDDPQMLIEMVTAGGHYVFQNSEVEAARGRLFANVRLLRPDIEPEQFVLARIKESIARYVRAFNLAGIGPELLRRVGRRH